VHLDPDLRALQEVRDYVARAKAAMAEIAHYDQAQTDRLVEAMAKAASAASLDLARLAVEETGIGRVHYKVLKNLFGSEGIWASIRNERTVGILSKDETSGVIEVATPSGVIASIVPTTNPTSTALGKALISVKGKNATVISPHPRAKRCIGETVEVMRRAIERVGGPPDLVLSLTSPTIESTGALMKHRHVALILATGGSGLVRAAYSSGKPAYGVGPGNVPCYVDRSADVRAAAAGIVGSQSFDNATLCCSEQGLVVDRAVAERLLTELRRRGAHVCSDEETRKLEAFCNRDGHMNPDVVGKDPWIIADMAGFGVPRETSLLLAHQRGVGREHPLSIEILCPLLSVHVVDGWREGCEASMALLHLGGLGHTCAVWANDDAVLEQWFLQKPASRIVVNGGASQGAVGYSTGFVPSMSLGCGPQAGNITSDNITARHLINVKRASYARHDWPALERADHERVMAWMGQGVPRGSGLNGDPALGSGERPAVPKTYDGTPNWSGNPTVDVPPPPASPALRPKVQAAPKASGGAASARRPSAPTFTRSAPARSAAPVSRPAPASSPPARPASRGSGLSANEIEGILASAGSGCPLGPCQGCPHMDVKSGACTA